MLKFNGVDGDAYNDVFINPLDIAAIRSPIHGEFAAHVRCVIFSGAHKFGVAETVMQVLRLLEDYEIDG